MKKTVLMMSLILGVALALGAQDYKGKGRLLGIVTDEQGHPIEGVKVKLFSVKAQEGFEVTTGKDGKWTAAWIRGGRWNIDYDKLGYAPKAIFVDISETKKNPEVEVTLAKVEGPMVSPDLRPLVEKGNELFEQKKYDEAAAVYQDILGKFPSVYPIYKNLANCYFAEEKYDLAEQNYLKVLAQDPHDVEAIIAVGNCYSNIGDTAKALEWYAKVDFDKITDPTVLYNLGVNYSKSATLEEALKCFKKALEVQPDFADAQYQLGLTYVSLQKNDEAVATFEDFLKLHPDSNLAPQVRSFLDYLKKK
jgi:tetratricopeptide (TPR) repeat protein